VSNGTLYITGNEKADALLNRDGTALLVGMLLDQQVPMEWAFTGPFTIKQRIGHLNPAKIAEFDQEEFVSICAEKPAIHRFPASMARRIHELCAIVADEYKNKGSKLAKRFAIKPKGWEKVAAPFSDKNFRTVADITSPETLLKVRAWKKAEKAADLDKQGRPLKKVAKK